MRTTAKKNIRQTSQAEILSSLTKSLAFQVQMIMWEDRKSRRAGRAEGQAPRVLSAGTDAGLKKSGSLI